MTPSNVADRVHRDRVALVGLAAFATLFLFVTIAQPVDTTARRWFSDIALSGTTLISGFMILATALRMSGGRRRVSWALLGLGTLSWSFGMCIWSWYELVLKVETPFPSLADLGYLAMFPFMFAGLITLPAGRVRLEGRVKVALDALIVVAGFSTVAWITLLAPLYADAESSVMERAISLAYPLGDLLLLTAIVGGAARGWIAGRGSGLLALMLGIVMLIVADVGFAWLTQHDAYGSGSPIDLGWPLGHMLIALAASRQARSSVTFDLAASSPQRQRWSRGTRLLAPYLAVFVATAVAITNVAPELHFVQNVLVALAAATVLLASVRQFMTVLENDRLNSELRVFSAALESLASERRERLALLHDMASGLGGAGTRQAATTELGRVADLIAKQLGVRVAVIFESGSSPDTLRALASSGAHADDVEFAALRTLASTAALTGVPAWTVDEVVATGRAQEARLSVPLPGASAALGAIAVSAERGRQYAEEDEHFLESVANLVGLTLERVHAVDELRHEHSQGVQLLRAVPSVLIGTDPSGVVHLWNQAARDSLGLDADAVIGRPLMACPLPFEMSEIQRRMGRAVQVGAAVMDELPFTRADGSSAFMSLTVTRVVDEDGIASGHLLVGTDTTQRRELEEQLRHQALHDPLTDLANRALFRDRLEHALSRRAYDQRKLAVLFIDLDDFKAVNDSLGHQMGDRLLAAASARLQASLRASDTLARLGGDEFAVLLEGREPREVERLVETLLGEISRPFAVEGHELRVGASIGVATPLAESDSAEDLLRNADIAMYAAKERGKARAVNFDATLHTQALDRIELEADLRVAIERDELRVEFQPIVQLDTGEAIGAEALVRWQHPTRGLVSPAWFIPAAERTGQVTAIDLWVLRQSCAQLRTWAGQLPPGTPFHLSVNLSRADLDRPEITADIRRVLEEFGVDPGSIVLEVTESALAEDMPAAIERLKALKALGVQIAIDDFGTGYSSLASLQHLPFDILKIDKSFVDALEESSQGEEVIAAVIRIARVLQLQTVAEGVESWAQAQKLRRIGCELGQGYYFARPQNAEAAWRVIEESRAMQHTELSPRSVA